MAFAAVQLTMRDPHSTPLPDYITPLGAEQQSCIYLVERISDDEMRELDSAPSFPELDESGLFDDLPTVEDGLRALRDDMVPSSGDAANDSGEYAVRLLLFVNRSFASRRMLRTARQLVTKVGARRASLVVYDIEDASSAPEIARNRIAFTPTMVLETNEARTRVVGAAELPDLAAMLPDFAGYLR